MPALTALLLSNVGIEKAPMTAIVASLRGKTELRRLYLDQNAISDEGVAHLVQIFSENHNFNQVDLGSTGLGNAAALNLAEALSQSEGLQSVSFAYNPIDKDTESAIRELLSYVPELVFQAIVSDCQSLCPGGSLVNPDALHVPSGRSCREHEVFCASGDCGSCVDMTFESQATDCCGSRQTCPGIECPAGLALDREAPTVIPGYGECCPAFLLLLVLSLLVNMHRNTAVLIAVTTGPYSCGTVNDALPTGMIQVPCDEMGLWFTQHTNCCA
jgi:hypothetical protein